jgi:hypothetical protein
MNQLRITEIRVTNYEPSQRRRDLWVSYVFLICGGLGCCALSLAEAVVRAGGVN